MSWEGKLAVTISIFWCFTITGLAAHRTNLFLLALPVTFLFLIGGFFSLLCILVEWEARRWRSLLPLATCVAAIFVSGLLTKAARRVVFAWTFPSYEKVVARMESGAIPVSTNMERIPVAEKEARLVYEVSAGKDTNGILKVFFMTEGSFPAKHSGYYYNSSGVNEYGVAKFDAWPINEKIKDKWLFISN